MKAEVLRESNGGMWAWLFQRITAVFVFVALGVHLVATHILSIGELSYDNIAERLASGFFVAMDVLLLAAVIYHALNGVRMVALDYWFSGRGARTSLALFLWALGLIAFVYGMWALWPWIKA